MPRLEGSVCLRAVVGITKVLNLGDELLIHELRRQANEGIRVQLSLPASGVEFSGTVDKVNVAVGSLKDHVGSAS